MTEAWVRFRYDFDAMTDEEVEEATREEQGKFEEAEEWLEAVASWEAAGRPRSSKATGAE